MTSCSLVDWYRNVGGTYPLRIQGTIVSRLDPDVGGKRFLWNFRDMRSYTLSHANVQYMWQTTSIKSDRKCLMKLQLMHAASLHSLQHTVYNTLCSTVTQFAAYSVFWYMTPCSLVQKYRNVGGTYPLRIQGTSVSRLDPDDGGKRFLCNVRDLRSYTLSHANLQYM